MRAGDLVNGCTCWRREWDAPAKEELSGGRNQEAEEWASRMDRLEVEHWVEAEPASLRGSSAVLEDGFPW